MASMVWKVSFVVVLVAILMGLENQIDYERLCQVSCIEAEVNKYRLDPWDVQFLQSKFCALRGITSCRNKFSMIHLTNLSVEDHQSSYRVCQYKKKKNNCFHLNATFHDVTNVSKKWEEIRMSPFYEIDISMRLRDFSNGDFITQSCMYRQRRLRYMFFDFLDIGIWRDRHSLQLHFDIVPFDLDIKQYFTDNECGSFMIMLLIKLNKDLVKTEVNLHTEVFNQRESQTILSEGTRYYALIAICMNILSIGFAYYFVHTFIISLLGSRKSFHFDPHYVPLRPQKLHRPDLMCTSSNDLNIFTSYFWQGIISDHGFIHSVIFVCLACLWIFYMLALYTHFALLGDNVSILEQFPSVNLPWYFYRLDKIFPYIVVYVIPFYLVFMHTSIFIFFLFGFVLSLFVSENVFNLMLILPSLPGFNLYTIFIFFTILAVLFSLLFFFWNKKHLVECLDIQTLTKIYLWPTWPAQFLIFVSLMAKKRLGVPNSVFLAVWTLLLILCFYVSCNHVPIYLRYLHERENGSLESHNLNTSILGFWLFVPIFLMFSELTRALITNNTIKCLHKKISDRIWSVCFALSMTLFCVYTCNFYLFKLYTVLKEVRPGSSLLTLWAPILFHLTTYILEVWRSNYTMYETYLKSVLSYMKSRDNDGKVSNNARMENNDGDFVLVYRDRGEPNIIDDKYIVKGVLLFIGDGKCYVPGDFFFKAIKLQGGPGSIKSVVMREIVYLFLRLFPAVFLFWVLETIHFIENENYDIMLQAIVNNTLLLLYKGLFLHRKAKTFDVIAMQVQIDQFVRKYESWAFLSEE